MNTTNTIASALIFAYACGMACGAILTARTRRALVLGLLALLGVIAVNDARADIIGLHLYTRHPQPAPGKVWNDRTTGIYYRAERGLTAGVYCNSYSRPDADPINESRCNVTKYMGWTWESEPVLGDLRGAITVAAIHGYNRHLHNLTIGHANFYAVAVPSVSYGPIRITLVGQREYHLGLEHRF